MLTNTQNKESSAYVHFVHASRKSLFVGFFFIFFQTFSQIVPPSFAKVVDSIVAVAPKDFTNLHTMFRASRNDTILMRYLCRISSEQDYKSGAAYALNELGRKYRNISNYDRAIELHKEALAVAEADKNVQFIALSLNNLGVVYRRTSSIRTAMDYHQKALELAETVENPPKSLRRSINISVNSIGNLYRKLEQYEKAIEYFERALQLETELNNQLGQAINFQNLGSCKEELGDLETALVNYRTSLALNESINNSQGRIICNNSIAQIYLKQNNPEDALEILEANLLDARKLGDGLLIVPVYIFKGWAKMNMGQYRTAEKEMLHGLKLSKQYNLPTYTIQVSHLLSELYKKNKDFEKALTYNVMAEDLEEKVLNENTISYVNDIIFRYDSQKKSNKIAMLAKENENVKLELRKNRTILLIAGVALTFLAGIFYILYRQYQLKNEKQLLTLEQTMLRSQMNPHFLFNSLNSIKLYIINNEQKNAVYYLNKFSKLVRKILEASSLREIPLAEELETAQLYMNIENIRFSNEIDFHIKVEDNIDVQNVKIPSLILQPFLENALWHGLSSKEGDKKIVITISKATEEGHIHIGIIDNGIGRVASEKIKLGKVLKRKSMGIDITKERLANFSRDYQNSFNLDIIDLFHDDGEAKGTKVSLYIPVI